MPRRFPVGCSFDEIIALCNRALPDYDVASLGLRSQGVKFIQQHSYWELPTMFSDIQVLMITFQF
jgi:hypothetical protein